jgi:DNA-binding beta-propeller fold protein YncE
VVLIFDQKFNFRTEFGYRGTSPGSLIVPDDVVVDDTNGLIYVAQAGMRGVNVYRIIRE